LFESLFFPICFASLFFNFNNRFIFAIFYLIVFSSISSVICIIICIIIVSNFNTLSFVSFIDLCYLDSLYLIVFIWGLLFFMFAIKYPIWPLHVWLPEVHVEVTTEMSALLASVVLKIGFFGIYKFVFLIFQMNAIWFLGFIDGIVIIGLSFISVSILFLCDYKKIIAHWSIIHTGIGLLLLWHNDLLFTGVLVFCNLGHIISSAFLFIIIGYMYDNYGLRIFLILISFFGISIWSSVFLCLFVFNIDFPLMLLFFVDIFVFFGLFTLSFIYILNFFLIIIIVFVSTLYIYVSLSYFSFIWINTYLRLDIQINDLIFFYLLSGFNLCLFYQIYILF
jgi:NADH:ubiquinone oxidoreductase subunit 4 (subunit M)